MSAEAVQHDPSPDTQEEEEVLELSDEEQRVQEWRYVQFLREVDGDIGLANELTAAGHVSWHEAAHLRRLGCPPETVGRILL